MKKTALPVVGLPGSGTGGFAADAAGTIADSSAIALTSARRRERERLTGISSRTGTTEDGVGAARAGLLQTARSEELVVHDNPT